MRARLGKLWAKRYDEVRLTKGVAAIVGATVGTTVGVLMIGFTLLAVWLYDESGDRQTDRRTDKAEVRDIGRRVVETRKRVRRLERNVTLCRQFDECAAALDRGQAPQRRRRQRNDPPDQRADRPPRTPAQPPSTPSPTPGGGGDDGPTPPTASTPSTPPSSPSSGMAPLIRLDPPPIDIDGPNGIAPGLLPNVNLPPVDIPPVVLPRLGR